MVKFDQTAQKIRVKKRMAVLLLFDLQDINNG